MFEKQPKIVSLDTISELCKTSRIKKSKSVIKEKIATKKILSKPKEEVKTKKFEDIILWL